MSDDAVFYSSLESSQMSSFKQYKVQKSGHSLADIKSNINGLAYNGHGPDYSIAGPRKIVVQAISDFERLMINLTEQKKIQWQTAHSQIMEADCKDRISAHLRHDVDLDIFTAFEIAKIEAKFDAPSTFYILHTAPYYGYFENGIFYRNESMLAIYKEIQNLGHEIALHTDAYFLYLNHNLDGAEAIRSEIEWLRSNGIRISGSVAHNSYPVYGVDNFAIFKGRKLRINMDGGPVAFTYHNKTMPLGVLDEEELGLQYEGNDIFFLNKGKVEYACLMNQDHWFCQTNRRLELDENIESDSLVFSDWLDQASLVNHINGLSRDYFLVLSIHPIFYGLRTDENNDGVTAYSKSAAGWRKPASWPTFEPNSVHAQYSQVEPSGEKYQSLSITDENGYLNRPSLTGTRGSAALKIMVLGGANLAGGGVSVSSQFQCRAEFRLETSLEKSVEIYKAAYPDVGLSRSIAPYLELAEELKPDYVVLGIKSDEFVYSIPKFWQYLDGWHPDFPPGTYLKVDEGVVIRVEASDEALSKCGSENPTVMETSLCLGNAGLEQQDFGECFVNLRSIIENFATRIRENGAYPILMIESCGEELGLWKNGIAKSNRIQAYQNLSMYIKELCKYSDLEILDPYSLLIDENEKYPTHLEEGANWNEHGNYVVSQSFFDFFDRLEASGRREREVSKGIESTANEQTTKYQNEHDNKRIMALKPYKTKPSQIPVETIRSNVNLNFFQAYGPDYSMKTAAHIEVDPPLEYRKFLKKILTNRDLQIDTFANHTKQKPPTDKIHCVIRHDLDGDLVAAEQQAKIEAELGIKSTYFLLHTAPYYNSYDLDDDGFFERNESSISIYRAIQELGHELALHTDGMTLYQSYNVDGSQAIEVELSWLRDNGCQITGTTAHNSFAQYGCENYSIFEGRVHGKLRGKKGVLHNGAWAPLQVLSEKKLGLDYEANELLWQTDIPVFYCALRSQNLWRCELRNFSQEKMSREYPFGKYGDFNDSFVGTEEVLAAIRYLETPAYVYIVVHPMHYGLRAGSDMKPWLAENPTDEFYGNCRLWAGGGANGEVVSSAITCLNEFETPDRGMNCYQSSDFKIAVFGQQNIATHTVSTDSKYSQVMARLIRPIVSKPYATAVSCSDTSGKIDKFTSALERMREHSQPDIILVAINSATDAGSEIAIWINELVKDGNEVYCIMEISKIDCDGEPGRALPEMHLFLECPILDPNTAFLEVANNSTLFWHESDIWTPKAHAIVGKLLADLVELNLNKK